MLLSATTNRHFSTGRRKTSNVLNGENDGDNSRMSYFINNLVIGEYLKERPSMINLALPEENIENQADNRKFIGQTIEETYYLNREWLFRAFRFVIFFAIGVGFYSSHENWNFTDASYFVTQTISTVGYGNLSPKSNSGKVFSIFFLYFGILLTFSVMGDITRFIVEVMRKVYYVPKKLSKFQVVVRSVLNLIMWIGILFAVPLFGGIVFAANEGWSYLDAFYFAVVTSTSVGYGDLVLSKTSSIWFNIIFILFSVSVTAIALEKISSFKRHLDRAEMNQILGSIEISRPLLDAIRTTEPNKINKAEYILHMLQLEGKIFSEDIVLWENRFTEFDLDRDRYLTLNDVHLFEKLAKKGHMKKTTDVRPNRKKSTIERVAEETKEVFLETLRLKAPESQIIDESSIAVTSPMQQALALRRASSMNTTPINPKGSKDEDDNHKTSKRVSSLNTTPLNANDTKITDNDALELSNMSTFNENV